MKETKRIPRRRTQSNNVPGLILALLFAALTAYFNVWLAAGEAVLALLVWTVFFWIRFRQARKMDAYIERMTVNLDTATRESITDMPLAMAVLDVAGRINWYNTQMGELFQGKNLYNIKLEQLMPELDLKRLISEENQAGQTVSVNGRTFCVTEKTVVPAGSKDYLMVLYLTDITELEEARKAYEDDMPAVLEVTVDNYDEVMQALEEEARPQMVANLEHVIGSWVSSADGVMKKTEKDRYSVVVSRKNMREWMERKFDILDMVRSIKEAHTIQPTLSIGVGYGGAGYVEDDTFANAALDMALGRGGDQVVVKNEEQFRYFGGKSKEVEKRTKVKARVMAYALRDLIQNAENVVIMGHRTADTDCVGAALGLIWDIRHRGKRVNMILGKYDETVRHLTEKLEASGEYNGVFVTHHQAKDMVDENTLVIVIDTHKTALCEYPELLNETRHIAVIDHHRRSADFIPNAALVYHEPYASSSCEMVTELIQYMNESVKLKQLDAQALYAGIAIDTKNFTFKAGVRTFEAAAFLKRQGADTVEFKKLLQGSMTQFIQLSDIVRQAELYENRIAISVAKSAVPQTVIAKAADELLNISGVAASFVLCPEEEGVILVSGRSLGDINVQVILEKLGGGGHMTVAGAQLEGSDVVTAKEQLEEAIMEYDKGE